MTKITRGTALGLTLVLCLGSLLGSAEAAKNRRPKPVRTERIVEFEYLCPCTGQLQTGNGTHGGVNMGGGPLELLPGERFITAEAVDQGGQDVFVSLSAFVDDDGISDRVGAFCGSTDEAMDINRTTVVAVIGQTVNGTGCPGPALGGVITFTISNLP